jgi:hypothetical protein
VNFIVDCRLPIADCYAQRDHAQARGFSKMAIGNRKLALAIFSCFSEIVVNHAATIFARFGYGCVGAFFVTADFVFCIQTFEHELARGNEFPRV